MHHRVKATILFTGLLACVVFAAIYAGADIWSAMKERVEAPYVPDVEVNLLDLDRDNPKRKCSGYKVPEGIMWLCDDSRHEFVPSDVRMPSTLTEEK